MEEIGQAIGASSLSNDPELARINQDLALKSLSLYRYRIASDGNCLFRAVASQLKLDQARYHPVLRKAAVKWMQANADELITGGLLSCVKEIDQASKDATWAGQAAIVALANIFSINIAVIQGGDKGDIDIQHISPFESSMENEDQGSVILAYMYNGHFDAVVDDDEMPNPDYEAWQYKQVHGHDSKLEISTNASTEHITSVPYTEDASKENIEMKYSGAVCDSPMTASFSEAHSAEASSDTDISSFNEEDNALQCDRTWGEIRLDHASRPTKELSQAALINQQASLKQAQPETESPVKFAPLQEKKDLRTEVTKVEDRSIEQGSTAIPEDLLNDDPTCSWAKSVFSELEELDSRSDKRKSLDLDIKASTTKTKLEDIPEEHASQVTSPADLMDDPWQQVPPGLLQDATTTDNSSSMTFTETSHDDDNRTTVIEPASNRKEDHSEILYLSNDDSVQHAGDVSHQFSLDSNVSDACGTSSISIALPTDSDVISDGPRPTLQAQNSQESLTGISPWSSFSQSEDKVDSKLVQIIDASKYEEHCPCLDKVPDLSVANVAPVPTNFKTIRDLPKHWANMKKESDNVTEGTILNDDNVYNNYQHKGYWKEEIPEYSSNVASIISRTLGNITSRQMSNDDRLQAASIITNTLELENDSTKTRDLNQESEINAIRCAVNINNPIPVKHVSTNHDLIPRISDSNDPRETGNKEEPASDMHVIGRVRVIPIQFCGKKGATLRRTRSTDVESGLSVKDCDQLNIPVRKNKQIIKAEIIEERGSIELNGQTTKTVNRKGTYTNIPECQVKEPTITLIEHRAPHLGPLSGSKTTITDNPNIDSPLVMTEKQQVKLRPVKVIHEISQKRSENIEESIKPRVHNIPVIVTGNRRQDMTSTSSNPTRSVMAEDTAGPYLHESKQDYEQSAVSHDYARSRSIRSGSSELAGSSSDILSSSYYDPDDNINTAALYVGNTSQQRRSESMNLDNTADMKLHCRDDISSTQYRTAAASTGSAVQATVQQHIYPSYSFTPSLSNTAHSHHIMRNRHRLQSMQSPVSYFNLDCDQVSVRNLLRPLNFGQITSLLNRELDDFFRHEIFSDF